MSIWEYFWGVIIIFSVISFSYMSFKVVYKGFSEMKEMFDNLK